VSFLGARHHRGFAGDFLRIPHFEGSRFTFLALVRLSILVTVTIAIQYMSIGASPTTKIKSHDSPCFRISAVIGCGVSPAAFASGRWVSAAPVGHPAPSRGFVVAC